MWCALEYMLVQFSSRFLIRRKGNFFNSSLRPHSKGYSILFELRLSFRTGFVRWRVSTGLLWGILCFPPTDPGYKWLTVPFSTGGFKPLATKKQRETRPVKAEVEDSPQTTTMEAFPALVKAVFESFSDFRPSSGTCHWKCVLHLLNANHS